MLWTMSKMSKHLVKIQNYTCEPVLLDSAQVICVKKVRLEPLAIASQALECIEHFE